MALQDDLEIQQPPSPAPAPTGIPLTTHPKQGAPLMKMMSKMMHLKGPTKAGIRVNSSIHIGHGHKSKDRRNNPKFY